LRAHNPMTPHIPHIHIMAIPEVTLTHLNRADGSATYTHNGYSLIGAVNGPIEVLRRDEMPEEATIEVNIRPAIGVGSMFESHMQPSI
jgi:exosome complex component RRP46